MNDEIKDISEQKENKKSYVGNGIVYGFIAGMLVYAVTQDIKWVGLGMCLGILLAAVKEMQDKRNQNNQ